MRLAVVAALVMALALAGCSSHKTAFSEPEARVAITQVLQRQVAAYAGNNAKDFYATYSPQSRKNCSFDNFLADFTSTQSVIGNQPPAVTNLAFIFNGTVTSAEVSFDIKLGDHTGTTSGNFVVVAGKWYEDDSPC